MPRISRPRTPPLKILDPCHAVHIRRIVWQASRPFRPPLKKTTSVRAPARDGSLQIADFPPLNGSKRESFTDRRAIGRTTVSTRHPCLPAYASTTDEPSHTRALPHSSVDGQKERAMLPFSPVDRRKEPCVLQSLKSSRELSTCLSSKLSTLWGQCTASASPYASSTSPKTSCN